MESKAAIAKIAQKFAARGQIDRAIAEWDKLLKKGQDGNIYNTIGDLHLRKGAKKEAIESFSRAADIFREDGFYLKAIALYKKILNISPSETSALIALGELNIGKGLIGNAIENFLVAAEIYIKEGAKTEALGLYEKTLQLAPHNINLKIKIAELYLRIGLSKEGVKEYIEIASDYLERGESDKAREFYFKVTAIEPQNIHTFIGLGKIAEKNSDIDQALRHLKDAMSFARNNKDILLYYAELSVKADKVSEAKNALLKVLEIEPLNVQAKKLLSSFYLKEGLIEKAWEELLPCIDNALIAERWGEALEFLEHFKDLDTIAVRRSLASVYNGMGNKEAALTELTNLARLYEQRGLHQDALQSYKEVLEINPEDKTTADKIRDLEETLGLTPPPTVEEEEAVEEEPVTAAPTPPKPEKAREAVFPEDFEEKKAEADFYAQHGFKDEAINIYERLLSISPDNGEIENRLKALKPEAAPEIKPPEETPQEETLTQTGMDGELGGVLDEFKKGIEKELGEEDPETHYNLGIAYKEMGLLDDAVKEFQIAAKDAGKTLQSSSMLASCYMEKKSYLLAIREFKKIIKAMSPADNAYFDVKYDLAGVYIKAGQYDNALKLYVEIQTQTPEFRDVAHKVEVVKNLVLKAKEKPKTNKDRVSYI